MLIRRHGFSTAAVDVIAPSPTLHPRIPNVCQPCRRCTTGLGPPPALRPRLWTSGAFATCNSTFPAVLSRGLSSARHLQQNKASSRDADSYADGIKGMRDKPVAILGGGITGLATAFYLTKVFPDRPITIFETKDVLAGWIRSSPVDVGDGEVIFESGPRSLRPQSIGGPLALQLVEELGLIDDFLPTSLSSPAARNRFVYYPDHLVRMPGPGMSFSAVLGTLITEPVFGKLASALWNEASTPQRSSELEDESVGSFIARRAHENLANNLLSAVLHGIYAGDVWQLSAKSIMPPFWAREARFGSILKAEFEKLVNKTSWIFCDDFLLEGVTRNFDFDPELRELAQRASVFTFKRGMGQLPDGLEQFLKAAPNVKILKSTKVTRIEKNQHVDSVLDVSYRGNADATLKHSKYSLVIATNPPRTLLPLLDSTLPGGSIRAPSSHTGISARLAPNLGAISAVTVCVVNLYFRTPNLLQTVNPPGGLASNLGPSGLSGFGYLLPASLPFEQNPERALGVIFDSDVSPELYSTVPSDKLGTRLTVMLGGHWWDGWSVYPNADEAKSMALSVLARHLGIREQPAAVKVSLQHECIPQYTVGHAQRMGEAHKALWDAFGGRLCVLGSWYSGVGVTDCLRAAFEFAYGLWRDQTPSGSKRKAVERTGLEKFDGERPMMLMKMSGQGGLSTIVDVDQSVRDKGLVDATDWENWKGPPKWRWNPK